MLTHRREREREREKGGEGEKTADVVLSHRPQKQIRFQPKCRLQNRFDPQSGLHQFCSGTELTAPHGGLWHSSPRVLGILAPEAQHLLVKSEDE